MKDKDIEFGTINPLIGPFASDRVSNESMQRIAPKDGEIENPFFIPYYGSDVSKMDISEVNKLNRGLLLCQRNNVVVTDDICRTIASQMITEQSFNALADYYVLLPCSNKIIANKSHAQLSVKVPKNLLTHLNSRNILLNDTEIVTCMPEVNELSAMLFLTIYDNKISLEQIRDLVIMYEFNECNSFEKTRTNLAHLISRLDESSYFSDDEQCNISLTNEFNERRFQYRSILRGCIKAATKLNTNNTEMNENVYDSNIMNKILNKLATSIDNVHDTKQVPENFKYNYPTSNLLFTKESITKWIENINDDEIRFNLFSALLVSADYSHLVINNKKILDIMSTFITKSIPYMRYPFSYAWLHMYLGEESKGKNVKMSDKFIFTLDVANKLPFFPYSLNMTMNPYNTLLVSNNALNYRENLIGNVMDAQYGSYGITSLEKFKTHFNIFTSGELDKNIFDGYSFKDNNVAVFGDVIPACSLEKSHLMQIVALAEDQTELDLWKRFYAEYYGSATIDLVFSEKSVYTFMDKVQALADHIQTNVHTLYHTDKVTGNVNVVDKKTVIIYVTEEYIHNFMRDVDMGQNTFDVKNIMSNLDDNQVREHFYRIYSNDKFKSNNKSRKTTKKTDKNNNVMYEHYRKPINMDDMQIIVVKGELNIDVEYNSVRYTFNDLVRKYKDEIDDDEDSDVPDFVSEDKNKVLMQICEDIHFVIKSKSMVRNIRVYKTENDDFMTHAVKYNFSCLRGVYTGEQVYLTPSCITALMTGVVLDTRCYYKVENPLQLVLDYYARGFNVLLNEEQKIHIAEYIGSFAKLRNWFKLNPKNKEELKHFFEPKTLTSEVFKPMKYLEDFPDEYYKNVNSDFVKSDSDLQQVYKLRYNYDPTNSKVNFLKFNVITDNGTIEPIVNWLSDAAYKEFFCKK